MLIYDKRRQMSKNYDNIKFDFSLIVEQILAFASSPNIVR